MTKSDTSEGLHSKLIGALTQRGWEWDEEKRLFRPKVPEEPVGINGSKLNGISQVVGLVNSHGS
jgi:hypothetical protein